MATQSTVPPVTPRECAERAATLIDNRTGLSRAQAQAFLPLIRAVLGHEESPEQSLPPAIAAALRESLERFRAVSGTSEPDANTVNAQLGITLSAIRDEARRQMDDVQREKAETIALLESATASPAPQGQPTDQTRSSHAAEVDPVAILRSLQALGGQVTRKP